MRVIGLTGGIASGKSAVSKILQEKGVPIIDADVISREVVKPGEKAWLDIVYAFGRDILHDDGDLDRKRLGKIVFSNPDYLEKLNKITHPAIINKINEEIEKLRLENQHKAVMVVVPLLFEIGMEKLMDEVWVVAVNRDTQIKRLILRENLTPQEAEQRLAAQMPIEEKVARGDRVIDNNGDIEHTAKIVTTYWDEITAQ